MTVDMAMFSNDVKQVIEKVNALREQVDDHWQIPADEALVLAQLVRIGRCRSVCEIGMSYGFSTLHLAAAAAETGGHVHSFDISEKKVQATTDHLTEAGLIDVVTLHLGDARQTVAEVTPGEPYDFAFIDAVKEQCFEYFDALLPKLADAAVVATDNTQTHPDALADFVKHLRHMDNARSCEVPVGNGFELTHVRR